MRHRCYQIKSFFFRDTILVGLSLWVAFVTSSQILEGSPSFSTRTTTTTTTISDLIEEIKNNQNKILSLDDIDEDDILVPNRGVQDIRNAIQDFTSSSSPSRDGSDDLEQGLSAWKFLRGIANSQIFIQDYWQKRPFIIRAQDVTGGWVRGCFTIERDLKLMDDSYITGFKTAEILRNGTKTDTWALSPLKDNPSQRTKWSDVEEALNGGTIYFNTAGSLWKNLGGLCRLVGYAFGLPPNVNVYCTPPLCTLSVPLHTDQQDVFVFQSQGIKRWKIYPPPPRSRGKDPLARGKNGDVVSLEEFGNQPPLIDAVLRPGDVMYVPTGFPHTTDTITPSGVMDGEAPTEDIVPEQEASVHLTMGLDTHVWFLALAHLRWSLLQRCQTKVNVDMTDDTLYWRAMKSLPLGFLGGPSWKLTLQSMKEGYGVGDDYKTMLSTELHNLLIEMEPTRWKGINNDNDNNDGEEGRESLPTREQMDETIEYFVTKHWKALMETQEELFNGVDAREEESLLKAFRGTQQQTQTMEDFGWFSHNKGMAESFRNRRLMNEQRAQMAVGGQP